MLTRLIQVSQNMYRSDEWRAGLWYIESNEEPVPVDARVSLTQQRDQRLKLSRKGIEMSILRESVLKTVIARLERLYSCWAALVDNPDPFREEDIERCRRLALQIIGEQKMADLLVPL